MTDPKSFIIEAFRATGAAVQNDAFAKFEIAVDYALEQAAKPQQRYIATPGPVPHDREGAYIRGLNDAVRIITTEVRKVVLAVEAERTQAARRSTPVHSSLSTNPEGKVND